jgi:hypothetical protein
VLIPNATVFVSAPEFVVEWWPARHLRFVGQSLYTVDSVIASCWPAFPSAITSAACWRIVQTRAHDFVAVHVIGRAVHVHPGASMPGPAAVFSCWNGIARPDFFHVFFSFSAVVPLAMISPVGGAAWR